MSAVPNTSVASSGQAMTMSATGGVNPYQPTASKLSDINQPGSTNHGICSITYKNKAFRFRTNPNEIWWTYELITHIDETYGGRVLQLLGTRLGDLTVKVECGAGGWNYLMQVVTYLRDVMSDQREGSPAIFEYSTRNWKLGVYAMNIPFQDEVEAIGRELTLNFKIQEDVSGIVSSSTLASEFARIQEGVYTPSQNIHNQYNDFNAGGKALDTPSPNTNPVAYQPVGQPNKVDSSPQGNNPGGLNILSGIPLIGTIPGLGSLLGGS